ncbi:MAG TPA: class I SAM-dependent methyltransferase [Terriglobales bacterium]|nr:class I SAM-dependent methyltransferase [Terriglobales bacterium]
MTQTYLSVHNTPEVASYYAAMRFISPCEKLLFDRYIPAGAAVLDLGVGGGRTTAYLAPQASRYVGVDYAEEMVRVCREKFPEFEFQQADASDLSRFRPAEFDVVLMAFNGIDSLSAEGRNRCFAECFRLLRSGGTLIFSSHNVRAVLVAPVWDRERVLELASRLSLGKKALRYPMVPLVTCAAVMRAWARASWASARRSPRMATRAFWRGEGYMEDPAYGGFLQHYSVPKLVVAEVESHGFRCREIQSSEYPVAKGELFTKWYYYAFVKPESS